MEQVGDLIDKLSIVNIKIWDATEKFHIAHKAKNFKKAHDFNEKLELMNVQRRELIKAINSFFSDKQDILNDKTYK